jgi:hypothetical protein
MIPAGLAATSVAFKAWKAAAVPNLDALGDEELNDVYNALAALLRDMDDTHAQVRQLVVRRVMARKRQP